MKQLTILIIYLLINSHCYSQANFTTIIGHFKYDVKSDYKDYWPLIIKAVNEKGDTALTRTDVFGNFRISIKNWPSSDLYYCGVGIRQTYFTTQVQNEKGIIDRTFDFPKKYKFNWLTGKAKCPKCGKSDKTIRLVYGLGDIDEVSKAHLDKESGLLIYNGSALYGSCLTSRVDPQWHCIRDKIAF